LHFQLRRALDALEKLEKVSSLTARELPILSMKGMHLYINTASGYVNTALALY